MMELTKHIWFCEFLKSFFFKEKVPVYKAVYSFYYLYSSGTVFRKSKRIFRCRLKQNGAFLGEEEHEGCICSFLT